MTFHNVEQGSNEWFKLRMGVVTASELDNLLTPDFKPRTGQTPKTYLFYKLAELHRGKPLITTGGWATEQGQILQDEALGTIALELNCLIKNGGFFVSDNGLAGCSPDGIVGSGYVEKDTFGVEIKCPQPSKQVQYLLEGILPADYVCQIYGSLYASGLNKWVFASYCRGFPLFVREFYQDSEINAKIDAAVNDFQAKLGKAQARLRDFSE